TNGRRERDRIAPRANQDVDAAVRGRQKRPEILRDGAPLEPLAVHVADHADDAIPVSLVRRIDAELFANWIGVGEESPREGFVHDDRLGDGARTLFSERLVRNDTGPHGANLRLLV